MAATSPAWVKNPCHRAGSFALVLLTILLGWAVRAKAEQAEEWQTVAIDVRGLPDHCRFVESSCPIDLTVLLAKRGINGAVDGHSIRLLERSGDGTTKPIDVQWTPDPQPRVKGQHLLPPTTRAVSYVAEYEADRTPPPVRVRGTLTWIIRGGSGAERHYQLKFRVPHGGAFVQAPFEPRDLHAFDAEGRASSPAFPTMQIHPQRPINGAMELFDGSDRILGYHLGPDAPSVADGEYRRPFLYPVIGPDGIPLTEFGKPHDPTGSHAHHYSLWIAHSNVNGHDFWGEKGGVIVNDRLDDQEDGPVFCRVVQSTRWVFKQADLLHERRTVTLYRSADDCRVIDFDLRFMPAGKEPVTFGKSTFGFLAARVRQSMTVFDGGGEIVNSKGDRNEAGAHLKHADWIDQSGPVASGKWGGIAILDHPDNPNHPSMFHCRNDGWACASFTGDAPYVLHPGQTLHLRYRVLLHRGSAAEANVTQYFADYAASVVSLIRQ